jgi:DNA repair protein RadC
MDSINCEKDNIKDHRLGHRQRLRDKFADTALSGLHDYEAIELLLTYALPRRDVKPLAKAIIERFGTLRGVMDATLDELRSVKGVGENVAVLLRLVKEFSKEYHKEAILKRDAIASSNDVIKYLSSELSGEKVEKFMALYLNSKNEVIAVETLHEGTIDQTIVYPRKAIEFAFKHNARSIIFVHNHPSGDPKPSRSDKDLTDELVNAAKAMDIKVYDHIIIGKGRHFSGRENGWLKG